MPHRIEPLTGHERGQFSSGDAALDDWFHKRAGQDQRRNVARVFVAVDDELGVIGFYTLRSFAIDAEDLPAGLARRLPRYEALPAILIGRLARDQRVRGTGIGELLLGDAVLRVVEAVETVAAYVILVDAKSETAARFYESFGFERFASRPLRLYIPVATGRATFGRH